MSKAHPKCWEFGGHICHKPSGRVCCVAGCDNPAGTLWGPYFCPRHDVERLDRVSAGLRSIVEADDA